MIKNRPHPPKTAALVAYDAGALSAPRRAQVEAHLSGCDTCRTELASIRLWSRESARMRAVKTVPVDFSKMELALAREAKSETQKVKARESSRRALPFFAPLALAATVLLTIGFDRMFASTTPEAESVVERVAVVERAAMALASAAEVTLVAGEARERGVDEALEPGARVDGASVLDVRDGEVHLALVSGSERAAVAVLENTSLGLPRVDASGAELELLRGRIAVRAGFSSESRVVVLAAGYRVEATTAVFDMVLGDASGLELVVREGSLRVTGLGTDQVLTAPMRFAPPEAESSAIGDAPTRAPALAATEDAVLVRIERPSAVAWELEGARVEGTERLAFQMVPGPLHLVSIDSLGHRFELSRIVGAEGLLVAGDPLTPTAPSVRGYLDPTVINGVVRTSLPNLQRCYEHALRMRPELGGGALVVRVTVATDGTVVRTRIDGGDVPATLQTCVTDAATRWTFPSPGAPMSFDLPLRFRAH